jgi:membrane-associated phospholipid phosphatase
MVNDPASLITTREAIAGPWSPPQAAQWPKMPAVNALDTMNEVSADVRARVLDAALFRPLSFKPEGDAIALMVDQPGGAQTLMKLTRPAQSIFAEQLDLIESYAHIRADRAHEIVAQIFVPFGFFSSIAWLHPDRRKFTIEFLMLVFRLCAFAHLPMKVALGCPRPNAYSPQIQPIVDSPLHGALPSGHATEAFAIGATLAAILKTASPRYASWEAQLLRLAERVAVNRTIAGVHFPIDSMAGAALGLQLSRYLVRRCVPGGSVHCWHFKGPDAKDARTDFSGDAVVGAITGGAAAIGIEKLPTPITVPNPADGDTLVWLWKKAVAEWA